MGFKSIELEFNKDSFTPSAENVSVTWDGRRIITVGESQVDLNQLANEVIQKSREPIVDTLTDAERGTAIGIILKLNEVYKETDLKIKTKNIFTQALARLRDVFVRDKLDSARMSFRGVSLQSFNSQFTSGRVYWSEDYFLELSKQT